MRQVDVVVTNLRLGVTRSCGCLQKEKVKDTGRRNKAHGRTGTKEYTAWRSMLSRCNNPANQSYELYGGKGIKVCQAWAESFERFFKDMGECPTDNLSLDRIDSARGYEPGNCRWATSVQQNRNRPAANRLLTLNGKTQCVAAWAEEVGIDRYVIQGRLRKGWSVEETLTVPVGARTRWGLRNAN